MISFTITTEINAPLEVVTNLFEDRSRMPDWQHGFISDEKTGERKQGSQYKLVYKAGKRNITLIETILHHDLPSRYDVMYRMKGMKNFVQNRFFSKGESITLWEAKHSFKFRWLMLLIGPHMKKELEQQSGLLMRHFKMFVEREYMTK